jgi:hypothetical protein
MKNALGTLIIQSRKEMVLGVEFICITTKDSFLRHIFVAILMPHVIIGTFKLFFGGNSDDSIHTYDLKVHTLKMLGLWNVHNWELNYVDSRNAYSKFYKRH